MSFADSFIKSLDSFVVHPPRKKSSCLEIGSGIYPGRFEDPEIREMVDAMEFYEIEGVAYGASEEVGEDGGPRFQIGPTWLSELGDNEALQASWRWIEKHWDIEPVVYVWHYLELRHCQGQWHCLGLYDDPNAPAPEPVTPEKFQKLKDELSNLPRRSYGS